MRSTTRWLAAGLMAASTNLGCSDDSGSNTGETSPGGSSGQAGANTAGASGQGGSSTAGASGQAGSGAGTGGQAGTGGAAGLGGATSGASGSTTAGAAGAVAGGAGGPSTAGSGGSGGALAGGAGTSGVGGSTSGAGGSTSGAGGSTPTGPVVLPEAPAEKPMSALCLRVPAGLAPTNAHIVSGSSGVVNVEPSDKPVVLVLSSWGDQDWKIVAKPGAIIQQVYLVKQPTDFDVTVEGVDAKIVKEVTTPYGLTGSTYREDFDAVRTLIGGYEASYQDLSIEDATVPYPKGGEAPTGQPLAYNMADPCTDPCPAPKHGFGWLPEQGQYVPSKKGYEGDYAVKLSDDRLQATYLGPVTSNNTAVEWELQGTGGPSCGKYYYEVTVEEEEYDYPSRYSFSNAYGPDRKVSGRQIGSIGDDFWEGFEFTGTKKRVGVALDLDAGRVTFLGPDGVLEPARSLNMIAFDALAPSMYLQEKATVTHLNSGFAYQVPVGYTPGLPTP